MFDFRNQLKQLKKVCSFPLFTSSQTSVEFDLFLTILENFLTNISSCDPHFTLILSDFNVKSKTWLINDQPTTEGT